MYILNIFQRMKNIDKQNKVLVLKEKNIKKINYNFFKNKLFFFY